MYTMVILAITTGIAVGTASAYLEAREIRRRTAANDRRKLDHNMLTIYRALALGPVAVYIGGGVTFAALLWLVFMALIFAPVHRTLLNKWRGIAWWYMGPSIRSKEDSRYDKAWWSATAYKIETYWTHEGKERRRYHVRHDALPWVACTAFEVVLTCLTYALINHTTT